MIITESFSDLFSLVSEFKNHTFVNNEELDVRDLGIEVLSPNGLVPVLAMIKKENLSMMQITLSNGCEFECAEKHILVSSNDVDTFAKDLSISDKIKTNQGDIEVVSIKFLDEPADCYDISVPAPFYYYDAAGVMHHNTITTATLAHICEQVGRTLTIVPNKSLVEQTAEDFVNVGLDVGVYYGDKKELNKKHTICTWQSLEVLNKKSKNGEAVATLSDFLDGVRTVIVDECHQSKASVLRDLLSRELANAPVRWGLTGTIPKEKADAEVIFATLGKVVGTVQAADLQEKGVLSNCHVNVMQLIDLPVFKSYAEENKYLVTNPDRLEYLSKVISGISASGNTLVLVNRVDTGKQLEALIPDSVFLSGADKSSTRKEEYDSIRDADNKVLICTFGIAAVGINLPRIFNLVLIEPGKSFIRVIQSIGRGLRKAADKDHVEIYDVTSTCKYAKKHLTERKKYYKEARYNFTVNKVDWSK